MPLSLTRPSRERAAQRLSVGEKRLHADIPADLHQQVKAHCFERGIQIREFLLELLALKGFKTGGTQVRGAPRGRGRS